MNSWAALIIAVVYKNMLSYILIVKWLCKCAECLFIQRMDENTLKLLCLGNICQFLTVIDENNINFVCFMLYKQVCIK